MSASGAFTGVPPTVLEGYIEGTSNKNGAFLGPLAGVQGSWLNRTSALYVEGGNLFFLTGEAPGTLTDTAFSMSGTFGKSASQGAITLTPGEGQTLLDALIYAIRWADTPQFFPTGSSSVISNSGIQITPNYFMATAPYLITNEGKKVAAIGNIYTGSYSPAEGASLPYMGYAGDYEYALGPLSYSHDTTNKKFTVDTLLQSIGIDYGSEAGPGIGPYLGVYSMRYLGMYDDTIFRMAGAGTYVGTPANFFGLWGSGGGSLYYNESGVFTYAGEDYGYFGGTTAPWTSPASFTAIGSYSLGDTIKPHYLMNTYIDGYTSGGYGGTITGFAGAIWKDGTTTTVGSIDGALRALYISAPDADQYVTAGIMKSDISGSYYPFLTDSGMWRISGTLTPTPQATGLDPSGLSIYNVSMSGGLSGTFGGGVGSIYGEDDGYSQTAFLYTSTQSLPFGIFNLTLGNSDNPNYYTSKPTGNTSWSANLGGTGTFGTTQGGLSNEDGYWLASVDSASGTWTDPGEIRGNVTGKALTPLRLYDMEGKFYGVTNGATDTWVGQAIGSYTGTPLKFSSIFSTDTPTPGQVQLYRALPGTYYDGGYQQQDENGTYYEYEYKYVDTSASGGKGMGNKKDHYAGLKSFYFPDNTQFVINSNDQITKNSPWDIGNIDQVKGPPSDDFWKPLTDPTFAPYRYSKWASPIDVLEQRSSDTFGGILGSTGYPWYAGGASITIIGSYLPYLNDYTKPTIFTTQLSGKFYSTSVEDGNTNGAYEGTMGGFLADDVRGVQIGMRGVYIGPDNNTAGVLRGSYAGSLYKDLGMWDAEGTLSATVMNSNFENNPAGVTKDNLSSKIVYGAILSEMSGHFTSDGSPVSGSIIASMTTSGATRSIKGQDWGILNSTIWTGGYGVPSSTLYTNWSARVGAGGQFGEYQDSSSAWQPDTGTLLMSINGTFTDGVVKSSETGTVGEFMTMTKMGTISDAGVLGIYTPEIVSPDTLYSWQGVMGGVWKTTEYLKFASSFGGSARRFAVQNYGDYSGGSKNYHYYYYTDTNSGDITFYNGINTTTTKRRYEPDSGPFSIKMWEEFTYDTTTKVVDPDSYQSGTYTTLDDRVFTDLAVAKGYPGTPTLGTWSGFTENGSISAIMGGAGDLWSAASTSQAAVNFLGDYKWWYGKPSIFGTDIVSYNVKNATDTTLDGKGAYAGYIGGREIDGAIDGRIYAIYIADTTAAGILKGTFTGIAYQDIEMWEGTGGMYPVYLMNVAIPYTSLRDYIYTNSFVSSGNVFFTLNGYQMGEEYNRPFVYEGKGSTFYSAGEGSWGVWQSGVGGKYTDIPVGDSWSAFLEFTDSTRIMGQEITGTKWSSNKIAGTTIGYGADITPTTPVTWVSVGEVMGTFNPTLSTFQAVNMGVSIETNTFLALAATADGRTQLQKLNVPCVEVGNASLTGSGNNMTVAMNNVIFFSNSAGAVPKIWATGGVSGSYTATPSMGVPVALAGSGLSANFNVQQWNTNTSVNKWLATVTNGAGTLSGGSYSGSVTFKGVAAGSITPGISTSGTFSGTAAGVAK